MIVGLDLSLASTGVCVLLEGEQIKPRSIVSKPLPSAEQRLSGLVNSIVAAIPEYTDLIVIESLSFGHNTGSGSQIQALNWMIRVELWRRGYGFLMVAPTALKKFVCNNGLAKKDLVLLSVYKRWGVECEDDNQADAVGLAKIGAAYLGLNECTTKAQREVIAALKAPKGKKARKKRAEAA